ncbi:hypothetical protein J23TS9_40530 [Paenibacillus sp. J23TS9]|uniref:hypothetical protein n=1 Tax=Paenibacillus sp. J23TS9 TaxID=2807193 RepID=UPI001B135B01|nr:hypothetical protein [Paenibacillus sp. J23TS9]GIP28923.1 hypothetical protein J23TS9_40530 [Paenibacillus sp. J23TS9]
MTAKFKGNKMNIVMFGLLLLAVIIRLALQWTSDYTKAHAVWNIIFMAVLLLLSFRFAYVYARYIRIKEDQVKVVNIQGTRTFDLTEVEKVMIYDNWIRFTMKADRDVFIHIRDLNEKGRVPFVTWAADQFEIEKD